MPNPLNSFNESVNNSYDRWVLGSEAGVGLSLIGIALKTFKSGDPQTYGSAAGLLGLGLLFCGLAIATYKNYQQAHSNSETPNPP